VSIRRAHARAVFRRTGKGHAKGLAKGRVEGERKGLAEGERKALLRLLRTRGLSATAEEQAVIAGCTDLKKLEQWIVRAVTAASVGEVLGMSRKPRTAKSRTKHRTGR